MHLSFGKSFRKLAIIYGTRGTPYLTLLHTSYADNLKFIKNKNITDRKYQFGNDKKLVVKSQAQHGSVIPN